MKGSSYDLWKDTTGPSTSSAIAGTVKRLKSSSVEVKWMAPFKWCSRNSVTICLLCFSGLMFPVCKFIVCSWDHLLDAICLILQVSLCFIFSSCRTLALLWKLLLLFYFPKEKKKHGISHPKELINILGVEFNFSTKISTVNHCALKFIWSTSYMLFGTNKLLILFLLFRMLIDLGRGCY